MNETTVKEVVLDEKQLAAVKLGADVKQRIVAITGGAGTGKTTTIRELYNRLTEQRVSVRVAAPTGKAARRIKEATGIEAVTVHKLLEYNRPGERDPKTGEALDVTKPSRCRAYPLDNQVTIVDEYAMMGNELHDNLIAALPSGGAIRAVGDVYQLPPVEKYRTRVYDSRNEDTRTPFQKLLARDGGSIYLEHVYRQEEGSNILLSADKIRRGFSVPMNQDLGDFYVKLTSSPIEHLKTMVIKLLEVGIDYRQIANQLIVPSKKSFVGTKQLNSIMQNLLNPNPIQTLELPRYEWDKDRVVIGVGDKVVCTENTYDLRDYFQRYSEWDSDMRPISHSFIPCPDNKQMLNGETGVVLQIYPDGAFDVDFGDRIVEVPAIMSEYWSKRDTVIDTQPARSIDLAYALTTHKCQGSEFDNVIYVINKSTQFAQSRQNFYTAVTRAKKRLTVIADQYSMNVSIRKVAK